MGGHRTKFDHASRNTLLIGEHFSDTSTCGTAGYTVQVIEQVHDRIARFKREAYWMKELQTIFPYGLNDRCNYTNYRYNKDTDIVVLQFNPQNITRHFMSNKSKKTHSNVLYLTMLIS